MDQLVEQQESVYPQGRAWISNLNRLLNLKSLPLIMDPQPPVQIQERSMWNPLVGGMFLTYVTYFANLEGGVTMIDSFAQLRIVLHLSNALKQSGMIKEGKLPILDNMEKIFTNCHAIWAGSTKPEQGEFVFRWWIAYGMNADVAIQCADDIMKLGETNENHLVTKFSMNLLKYRNGDTIRQLLPTIKAEEISKSYRRICLRDFEDIKDAYVFNKNSFYDFLKS